MLVPVIICVVCAVALLFTICLIRALSLHSVGATVKPLNLTVKNDSRYAESLSAMIQIPTVSAVDKPTQNIERFIALLKTRYPAVHRVTEVTNSDNSLIFCWKGSDQTLAPICFMAHMDVVEAQGEWKYDPFGGVIADGYIWGRGTVDTKNSLCAILEAAEELAVSGFLPERDVYFSFGRNEEVTGNGAPLAVEYFKSRGIRFDMVLDEGGVILDKAPLPGIKGSCAVIGIMEKGYGDIRFTAKSNGGHASTPPKNTPIARLAAFVCSVENSRLFKSRLSAPLTDMLRTVAAEASFPFRFLFSNLWLFGPLVQAVMKSGSPQVAAMLSTTCAFTAMKGSDGFNVLPETAWIGANCRFMPHQNKDETFEMLKKHAARFQIEAEWIHGNPASAVTDIRNPRFIQLRDAIYGAFDVSCVAPYIMIAGTDSRYFCTICDTVMRFAPFQITGEQLKSVHAKNEHLSIDSLNKAVACYRHLITTMAGGRA